MALEKPVFSLPDDPADVGKVPRFNGSVVEWADVGGVVPVSATPPPDPATGDLWYDSDNGTLSIWDGAWIELTTPSGGGAILAETAPSAPTDGMLWFDTDDEILYVYDGGWVVAGGGGLSPAGAQNLIDLLDFKQSVKAATTVNITLSGTQTVDGVSVGAGDRVLVKDQSAAAENGIYVASSGAWARSDDAASDSEVNPGLFVIAEQGTVNGDKAFILTTNAPITLGTTALTFAQVSGGGDPTMGGDLTGTASNAQIAAGAVGPTELADNAVTNAKVADDAVGVAELSATGTPDGTTFLRGDNQWAAPPAQDPTLGGDLTGTASAAQIAAGAIVNADINAAAGIALSKLAQDPLARANHTGTQTASTVSDFDTQVRTSRLDQMAAPTAAVAMNSQRVTGLADPVGAQDAATRNYVDNVVQGLDAKPSVRAATTGDITLSGTQTVDGVALQVGDRVLVKDQSTGSENGIYVVQSGAWARAADANTSADVTAGMYAWVTEGTTNADTGWVLTTNDLITLGTTALAFTQFTGAGQITAGAALTKTGNQLDVAVDNATVEVSGDQLRVKAGGVGPTELADNAVTNAKVADDAVGIAELSATGTPSSSTFLRGDNQWVAPPAQDPTMGGDLTGTASNAQIAAGVVGPTELADNAVTNAKMADDSVGIAELSATGTADGTTFLRGDNSWATPAGGGGGDPWGGIIRTFDPGEATNHGGNQAGGWAVYLRTVGGAATITKIGLSVTQSAGAISVAQFSNTGTGRSAAPGTRNATSGSISCPAVGYTEVALGASVAHADGDWLALSASFDTSKFGQADQSTVRTNHGALTAGRSYVVTSSPHPIPATPTLINGTLAVILLGIP